MDIEGRAYRTGEREGKASEREKFRKLVESKKLLEVAVSPGRLAQKQLVNRVLDTLLETLN